jgi:hypothetical protein
MVSYALAVVLPVVIAWLGLHPAGATFENDTMHITSAAVAMPGDLTFAFLGFMYLVTVLVSARYAGDYHDTLLREKTRNELQAWQLRQLVPDEAAKAMRRLPSGTGTGTRP